MFFSQTSGIYSIFASSSSGNEPNGTGISLFVCCLITAGTPLPKYKKNLQHSFSQIRRRNQNLTLLLIKYYIILFININITQGNINPRFFKNIFDNGYSA